MKIEIIEKTKESLKFKMLNTRHTIPEMLKNQLLENKDVTMASYILEHPEDSESIFFVKVKKDKDVKKCLLNAIDELKKEVNSFTKTALSQIPKEEVKEKKVVAKKKKGSK